jgi:hypothetical protein
VVAATVHIDSISCDHDWIHDKTKAERNYFREGGEERRNGDGGAFKRRNEYNQ